MIDNIPARLGSLGIRRTLLAATIGTRLSSVNEIPVLYPGAKREQSRRERYWEAVRQTYLSRHRGEMCAFAGE